MGAGQWPAGGYQGGPYNPAGYDPAYTPASLPAIPQFRAIAFNPFTKTFVMGTTGAQAGFAQDIHPVDQRVILLLWVQQGRLGSDSTMGTRIKARIQRVAKASIPSIVRDEVQNVLSPLIASGDVQLMRVDVNASMIGRTEYAVFYKNLRDSSDNRTRKLDPQSTGQPLTMI
jgi:hypothetical protein